MNEEQDFLEKGRQLAQFIVPDRPVAIQILSDAANKLNVQRSREIKRTYWRRKHLKRKITRVIREDRDLFQWLIYFEAEKYERQQERFGQSTTDDLLIRYIKYLMQITTPMSSFYVNIGVLRLLHNYSTAEARCAYELVADHYPGTEEYRRVKGKLMSRLQERFGAFLKTCQINRGEVRFLVDDHHADRLELVKRCLKIFTPWGVTRCCAIAAGSSPSPSQTAGFPKSHRSNKTDDLNEAHRVHTFIHPPCLADLTRRMALDSPDQRLELPKFFFENQSDKPPACRHSDEVGSELTAGERDAISKRLDEEGNKRRQVVPQVLQIVVDGIECSTFALSHETETRLILSRDARLIEIWAESEDGNILLATHWIRYTDVDSAAPSRAVVELGKKKELWLKITPKDDSTELLLEYHLNSRLRVREFLEASTLHLLPKYQLSILILLLVISVVPISLHYRNELNRQHEINDALKQELLNERVTHVESQGAHDTKDQQWEISYRLSSDSLMTRGSQSPAMNRVVLSPSAFLARLELPVTDGGAPMYRATLIRFLENKPVIEENDLMAVGKAGNRIVILLVPTSFLLVGEHYVVRLDAVHGKDIMRKAETFSFYVSR